MDHMSRGLGLSARNMAVLFVRCVVLIEDEASISKVGACRCILGERGVSKEKTACLILTSHGSGSVQPISPKLVLTVTESAQSCMRQRMHISGIELIIALFRSCEVKHEKRRDMLCSCWATLKRCVCGRWMTMASAYLSALCLWFTCSTIAGLV